MYNIEDSENPQVQKSNRKRHLWEVATLVLLTLLVSGFFVLQGSLLAILTSLCLGFAAFAFLRAMAHSQAAISAYRSVKFQITPQRLNTLQVVGVATDVTSYLAQFQGRIYKGEQKFFRRLEKGLGEARTREVRSTVFKYTKFES